MKTDPGGITANGEGERHRTGDHGGTRLPARAKIMAWMLLLLVVVLLAIVLLVRQFLHNDAANQVTSSLEQEVREFVSFAKTGQDPATGQPVTEPRRLFAAHLGRQYPDPAEALIGAWRTPRGVDMLVQAQRPDIKSLVHDPALLRGIARDPRSHGTRQTPAGPMRWLKVRAVTPGQPDAWFVTAHFTERGTAEADNTVRTLLLVSGFGVVLAAISSWVVAGAILAPVRTVRQAAAEIGEKDLTRRIPVQGRDDIAALAEQFNAMLDRLDNAFRMQRRFVDDASHELRTPITIVRGHLELLGEDPTERAEVVRLCTDELDRMTRIVEELLVLAKADRPDFVAPTATPLVELTSDIDAKVRTIADRRWRLEELGEGEVLVDQQRITQAVVQLAQNAVQHTDPGGEIRLGSALCDGWFRLWVSDDGPGVDPAEADRIFQRFSHGSTRGGGAGLGLAIVKAIAEAHRGVVRLVAEPGRGATFVLELPATPSTEEGQG